MQPFILNIICVTYNRGNLYEQLLQSIESDLENSKGLRVNFILINQNKEKKFIKHRKLANLNVSIYGSKINSVSFSKNLALKKIKRGYVWFLDDDCLVPKGAFNKIVVYINQFHKGFSFIADNINNKPLRLWPKHIHTYNFLTKWYLSFTINTIFPHQKGMFHDLNLGPPNHYGSCEDLDFSIRYFDAVTFIPIILIIHNDPDGVMAPNKIYSYSQGFGYLCRKHLPIGIFYMALSFIILIINFLRNSNYEKFKLAIKGRYIGFFKL